MKTDWKQLLLIAVCPSDSASTFLLSALRLRGKALELVSMHAPVVFGRVCRCMMKALGAKRGAAATGVALYYLLRDDGAERRKREADPKKLSKDDVSPAAAASAAAGCCSSAVSLGFTGPPGLLRSPAQQTSVARPIRSPCLYPCQSVCPSPPKRGVSMCLPCLVPQATKEQVLAVLHDIFTTQEKMKGLMKRFTQRFLEEEFTFEEACALVAKQHPDDPLRRYGLTMADFDGLLDKFQQDQEVKEAVFSIMGSASAPNPTPQAYTMSKEQLVKVHEFMRDELQNLTKDGGVWPKADPKVLTLAAQAYVGAKVQREFGFTSEDIEGAVLLNHKELATNAAFTLVNMAIQKTMNDLIGADA
ncbi:hypothetical protein Esti_003544 [Eimeria stiedai]